MEAKRIEIPNFEKIFYKGYFMESFYTIRTRGLSIKKTVIKQVKSFMLDSGAFTMIRKFKTANLHDLEKYTDDYAQYIAENDIDLYIELDVDKFIGKDKTNYLRERLIKLTNKNPIWVYQTGRTNKDFDEALERFDYVALPLSGLIDRRSRYLRNKTDILKRTIDYVHSRNKKIHALGATGNRIYELGFDSCDSSTFLATYGNILLFQDGQIKYTSLNKNTTMYFKQLISFISYLKLAQTIYHKFGTMVYFGGFATLLDKIKRIKETNDLKLNLGDIL